MLSIGGVWEGPQRELRHPQVVSSSCYRESHRESGVLGGGVIRPRRAGCFLLVEAGNQF